LPPSIPFPRKPREPGWTTPITTDLQVLNQGINIDIESIARRARSVTTDSSPATRSISISPGCVTSLSKTGTKLPEVIAREIVEDLTAALAEFEAVAAGPESQATQ
jgi:hypothetical protein